MMKRALSSVKLLFDVKGENKMTTMILFWIFLVGMYSFGEVMCKDINTNNSEVNATSKNTIIGMVGVVVCCIGLTILNLV